VLCLLADWAPNGEQRVAGAESDGNVTDGEAPEFLLPGLFLGLTAAALLYYPMETAQNTCIDLSRRSRFTHTTLSRRLIALGALTACRRPRDRRRE